MSPVNFRSKAIDCIARVSNRRANGATIPENSERLSWLRNTPFCVIGPRSYDDQIAGKRNSRYVEPLMVSGSHGCF